MKNYSKYESFINASKKFVGFTDYEVNLEKKLQEMDTSLAFIDVDPLEKILKIQLSKAFQDLEDDRKKNVLLHELIHGRVALFNIQKTTMESAFEEEMVNDITRGFERMKTLRWVDEENYQSRISRTK